MGPTPGTTLVIVLFAIPGMAALDGMIPIELIGVHRWQALTNVRNGGASRE